MADSRASTIAIDDDLFDDRNELRNKRKLALAIGDAQQTDGAVFDLGDEQALVGIIDRCLNQLESAGRCYDWGEGVRCALVMVGVTLSIQLVEFVIVSNNRGSDVDVNHQTTPSH